MSWLLFGHCSMTRWAVVFCTLFLTYVFAPGAWAAFEFDTHPLSPDADTHCNSSAVAAASLFGSTAAAGWTGVNIICPHVAASKTYTCKFQVKYNGVNQFIRNCAATGANANSVGPYYSSHVYVTYVAPNDCPGTTGYPQSHWVSYSNSAAYIAAPDPSPVCVNECVYAASGDTTGGRYTDANNDGIMQETESMSVEFEMLGTGAQCSVTSPTPPAPSGTGPSGGNVFDCTNTDCGPNPGPGTGEEGSGGQGGQGGDGGEAGTNGTGGAGGDGGAGGAGGSGGAGGDATAGDCNPLSNPECAEIDNGVASASDVCGSAPICSGDVVECAIVTQTWLSMCYEFNDTGNAGQIIPEVDSWGPQGWLVDQLPQDEHDAGESGALDDSGFLAGGVCPAFPAVSTPVGDFNLSSEPFCNALAWIGYLIMIAAGLASTRILMSARVFA